MKKNIFITNIFTLAICSFVNAQSTIDNVLAEVSRNNNTLQASAQYWKTKNLQYKTGLSLYNPTAEYDYLTGSPAEAGNQTDFTIAQSFDFPTAYIKKNQLAKQQIAQSEFHLATTRQDILLQAKQTCLELIYCNKLQSQLEQRKQSAEKLLSDFKRRLEKGEGNILDVNKAQIQLIEVKKDYLQNISRMAQLNTKLTELNGGNVISLPDTVYPALPSIPSFEQLEQEIEASDPVRRTLEQDKIISQKQIEVSKSLWLPKIEAGYHYQGILGQKFSGIHTGISIPLWENRNTVKVRQSQLLFADLQIQSHRIEHYYEIKQLYDVYTNLKLTLEEYQNVFTSLNSVALLDKALSSGHISTIEYFLEVNYFVQAHNNYLLTEREYYNVIAELFKYQL
jgi:outer membrane protein, heavy metal efflux system